MDRRVVITAESAITPIGHGRKDIMDSLLNGKSGVRPLKEDKFLAQYIHSKVFGTVDYEVEYDFPRKFRKTLSPVAFYACQVAKEVLDKAGLDEDFISSGRMGVAFGSVHGSPSVQRGIFETFFSSTEGAHKSINASDYLKSMAHTTAVNITRMFGITGRLISSCTACTTASQSIGYGYEAIRFGLQDVMLCGAADEYDTTTVAVFDNLLACSTAYNDTPAKTPRPFDVNRDGLVVGEGAGALLLEEYEFAKKRGAEILGEVVGFACNNNGGDLILPNEKGVEQCIKMGLENAKLNAADIDIISAHATSTKMGDIVEARAIDKCYEHKPYVCAFKSYMGHTMSACGAIEAIISLYMLNEGKLFPTLNLEEVDHRCDMLNHVQEIKDIRCSTVSIQNFAFGGVNTALFIKKV